MTEEAKVEEKLVDNWMKLIELLLELQRKWNDHSALVHSMNIDLVHPKLQGHVAHGFNRADFYLGLTDLIDYGRQLGGIEYLQIEKEKISGQRSAGQGNAGQGGSPRR